MTELVKVQDGCLSISRSPHYEVYSINLSDDELKLIGYFDEWYGYSAIAKQFNTEIALAREIFRIRDILNKTRVV